ncbi:hypothetical protein JCM33374_g3106 [Metschnikowia sp. JCM 33374]|nr:hypothetical protein JCM33374_g3106 [Metschnikowia sp. JCM 33374]
MQVREKIKTSVPYGTHLGHWSFPPTRAQLGIIRFDYPATISSSDTQPLLWLRSFQAIQRVSKPSTEINKVSSTPVDRNPFPFGPSPTRSADTTAHQKNVRVPVLFRTILQDKPVGAGISGGTQASTTAEKRTSASDTHTHDPKRSKQGRVSARTAQSFTLDVSINSSKVVTALLDSGATADFIDARLVSALQLQEYPLATAGEIYLASEGVKVMVTTEVTADLVFNGIKTRRGFFVYPHLTEQLVFGTPFMLDFAQYLDLSTKSFNAMPLNNRQPQDSAHVACKSITQIDSTRLERHCKSKENEVFTLLVKSH